MGRALLGRMLATLLVLAVAPIAWAQEEALVYREGDAVVFRGGMSGRANTQVRELLAEGGVRWLRITSGGGEVNLGMDLGELVRAHGLDVHVVDYCASSCANYVFPAGKRKLLPADSAVIWHGSAIQEAIGESIDFEQAEKQIGRPMSEQERTALLEQFRAYGDALRSRQAAFYAAIGVDERITVFGQELGCGCDWTILVADMARFGIDGIQAADGYGSHRPRGESIALLRLDDHPRYAAAIDAARRNSSH